MKHFSKYISMITLAVFVHFGAVTSHAQKEDRKKTLKSYRGKSSQNSSSELLRDADKLKKTNSVQALDKVEEALGISIAEQDEMGEAKSYLVLASINEGIEEWKLALGNYEQAYVLLKNSFKNSAEFKITIRGLGKMHLTLGQLDESLKYFKDALDLDLTEEEKASVQLSISEVYYRMGDYAESLKAAEATQSSDQGLAVEVQTQKAKIYARTNDQQKTRDNYQNSLNTLRSEAKPSNQQQEAFQKNKEEIAEALHDQKQFDDEISVRQQAIDYNFSNKNFEAVTKDKVRIGKTLAEKGDDEAALRELEEAVAIADTIDNANEQADAYLALANSYERVGKNSGALRAYKKFSEAIDRRDRESEALLAEKSEVIKKQNDIQELSKSIYIGTQEETLEQQLLFRQQLIIYGLLLIILIISIAAYFIYKNGKASKVANQLLALKSLRSQMNPHFIFNALNSVNHFIVQQDERSANQFLSEFSQLMRLVLENSQEDFISLQKENEILSLYLKLEHYRFRDKFEYELKVADDINDESVKIPPMLIQPYIENAVWHGLRYKETKGKLSVSIHRENSHLTVDIRDDGIGRKRSAELKTHNQKKHQSTGLKNIQERLDIINSVYKTSYAVTIGDGANGVGTQVLIRIPFNHQEN